MSCLSMLRASVNLQRKTSAKVGGAPQATYTNVGTCENEPCDIQPASSQVQYRFMQKQLVISHTIFFSRDVGAIAQDRFVDQSGNVYLVQDGGYQPPPPGYPDWPSQAHVVQVPTSPTQVT